MGFQLESIRGDVRRGKGGRAEGSEAGVGGIAERMAVTGGMAAGELAAAGTAKRHT